MPPSPNALPTIGGYVGNPHILRDRLVTPVGNGGTGTDVPGEGVCLKIADVTSATINVYQSDGQAYNVATYTAVLTVGSALYNALQLPDDWTKDTIGFNFQFKVPGSAWAVSGLYWIKLDGVLSGSADAFTWEWLHKVISGVPGS